MADRESPEKAAPEGRRPVAVIARKRKRADLVPVPTLSGTSGVIFSTGANMAGELGMNPDDVSDRWKPGPVKTLDDKDIVFVDAGGMHTAAISKDGKVRVSVMMVGD